MKKAIVVTAEPMCDDPFILCHVPSWEDAARLISSLNEELSKAEPVIRALNPKPKWIPMARFERLLFSSEIYFTAQETPCPLKNS